MNKDTVDLVTSLSHEVAQIRTGLDGHKECLDSLHAELKDVSRGVDRLTAGENVRRAAGEISTTVAQVVDNTRDVGLRISDGASQVIAGVAAIVLAGTLAQLAVLLLILWRVW